MNQVLTEKHNFLTKLYGIMVQYPFTFDFCGQIIKRVIIAKIFEGFISFSRASLKF